MKNKRTGIVRHIQNVYKTQELSKTSTCAKNAQVAADGNMLNPIFRPKYLDNTHFMPIPGRAFVVTIANRVVLGKQKS